jgi:short-subunit dehydrogenase
MTQNLPVALVTGAGSGIGRCLAHVLAHNGYAIALLDINEVGLNAAYEEMKTHVIARRVADVTDAAGLAQATRELEGELGPIDLLVANAGVGIETSGLKYNVDNMNKVLNVNLIGVSNSIGAVLPGMVERKRGHLVAISSIASYRGLPRMLAYCASKAGVNAIMDGLRVELTPLGIHVTTICPGWIKTAMTENIKNPEPLLDVEAACQEIMYAIRKRLAFHAFPRMMRWKLGFITTLPRSWQDAVIRGMVKRLDAKEKAKPRDKGSDSRG